MSAELPLYKTTEIIAYAIVDENLIDSLKTIKWYINSQGYAFASINGKPTTLHIYLLTSKKGFVIDHININKLDNRLENLRYLTYSENSRNRNKILRKCSSKYIGVSYSEKDGNWLGTYIIPNISKRITFTYDNEIHCAYHRDLLIKQYKTTEVLNNIEKPENFIMYVKTIGVNKILSKGIVLRNNNNKYQVIYRGKYLGLYKTAEEAEKILKEYKIKLLNEKNKPSKIVRNKESIAILITNKNEEILVDDDKYHLLINLCKWHIDGNGYPVGIINKKRWVLHKFLMKDIEHPENTIIDHINRNKFDARMNNLRYATYALNAHNTTQNEDTELPYRGIRKHGKLFEMRIRDGTIRRESMHNTMLEAANAYIEAANKIHNINVSLISQEEGDKIERIFYEKYPEKKQYILTTKREKSKYKGVDKHKDIYYMRITKDGKTYRTRCKSELDAGNEYIKKYNELYGTNHKLIEEDTDM